MRHIFLINPVAGNGKHQLNLVNDIHAELKDKKIEYEVYYTKCKGDVEHFLKNKCKDYVPSIFYACGGDGTLHEVINAAREFKHVSVGVIPCGSGNDFVKNFDFSDNFNKISAQFDGENVYLDLVKVNDKFAVSVCNIGLDADAAFNMHKFKKFPFLTGTSRYLLSVFYCLLKKLGKNLNVTIDDNLKLSGSFLLGVIANGHSYGGGYKCAPLAIINDGVMDLCFVDKISRFKIMNLIGNYKKGMHLVNPKIKKYITYHKCKHVKLSCNKPLNICIDGEDYIYKEVSVTVEKNALKFWLPKGAQIQCIRSEDTYTLTQKM